ncbi:MAG TPA: pitrilysin family protein [Acidimicrobiia bacterium]|nr:pitrilysin family protein [Acidimicrobiia bacterium]
MTAAMVDDASGIRRTRLDSGLRVVTEHLPGLRSAAVGFWVGTGSRDEPEAIAGTSHFLEHLLFKGTETRHAAEIAEAVESCGGDMNAFTGQEVTAYYVRVPDRFLGLALEILSDIVWSPALRSDEVESERQVILEEIRMRDDTPDDLVHDVFSGALFARHPLGREIAGSQDSIGAVTRDQIAAYHADHYQPSNVVVAVAGNVEHDEVVQRVVDAQPADGRARPARAGGADTADADRFARVDRPLEQSHVVLGARALRRDDPDRFALAVVDQVLGGGMSSRLFQEVREKRGLAYSVFSYRSAFEETGALAVYCATAPERVDETLDVVRGELDRLVADGGVTERELVSAKGHLTGSLALSLESSSSRMHRIGRSELTMGEIPSLDWVVEQVDAVTAADVARVIDRVLGAGSRTLAVVGPADALVAV